MDENFFDQFDDESGGGNFFDQFDGQSSKKKNQGAMSDLGTDLKIGVQQLPGAIAGIADIPVALLTGERHVSKLADKAGEITGFQPGKWAKQNEAEYSDERRQAQQDVEQAWESGDAGDIAGAYLKNPVHNIGGLVARSIPGMVAGGAIGKGVQLAAKGVSAVAGGALGEGAITAGSSMNDTPEDADARRAAVAALGAGAGTAVLGQMGGKLAQKAGLVDPDVMLAGGARVAADAPARGLAGRMFGGAVAEGVFEELPQSVQETMWSNWAQEKDLFENVPRAAVEGVLAGTVMGAGFNVLPAGREPGVTDAAGGEAAVDAPQSPPLALPAPTYTGTPSDQMLQEQARRENDVSAAQARADAIYAARAEFEAALQKGEPAPLVLVTDPAPLQQRIDRLLGIGEKPMTDTERASYERTLSRAFNEQVGITQDKDGREIPLTMADYLNSQVNAEDAARWRPYRDQATRAAQARLSQVEQEEVVQQPDIPVVGSLSAAANVAVRTGIARVGGAISDAAAVSGGVQNGRANQGGAGSRGADRGGSGAFVAGVSGGLPEGGNSVRVSTAADVAGNPLGASLKPGVALNGVSRATQSQQVAQEAAQANGQEAGAQQGTAPVQILNDRWNSMTTPERQAMAVRAGFVTKDGRPNVAAVGLSKRGLDTAPPEVRQKLQAVFDADEARMAEKPSKRVKPVAEQDKPLQARAARYSDDLLSMAQDAGWAETGGRLLRGADGQPNGRTAWVPRAEWFRSGMEGDAAKLAQHVADFLAGNAVPVKSRRTIEGMLEWRDAQESAAEVSPDASMYDLERAGYAGVEGEDAGLIDAFDDVAGKVLTEAEAMRALGFTEEEINEVTSGREGSGNRGPEAQDGNPVARAAREGEAGNLQRDEATGRPEGQAEGLTLESYTNEDIVAREEASRQREAQRNEEEARAEKEANDRETQAEVKRRSEAAASTFQLGQDGMDNLTGQGGMFDGANQNQIKSETPADAGAKTESAGADQNTVKKDASTVSENTIFTEDAAEKARAILKKKLGQLNSGLDPEMMQAGITLAGYHIEKGARTFAAYAKAMVEDLGESVKPYLKSWYMGVKYDPRASGFDGMSGAGEVESADVDALLENQKASAILKESEPNGAENAGTLQAEGVPGASAQGDAGNVANGNRDRQPMDVGVAGNGGRADRGRGVSGRTERAGAEGGGREDGPQPVAPVELGEERGDGAGGRASGTDDHVIDAEDIGKGGAAKKYADNIAAIKIIKAMEAEGRLETPEERKQIARYVGWGALKGVFDPENKQWSKQHAELKALLTESEFAAARKSVRNAHYTSPVAVGAMYDAMDRLGFTGGRVLEPSVGVGNFFGLMPAKLRNASRLHGVELDSLTSRLVAALYPKAKIAQATGFQDYAVPSEFFDAVIGNPPFGEEPIVDMARSPYSGFSIHNYFLAKGIDKLRPGGIMQVVVSHNFLDAKDSRARKWISERANLIGAVRLPNTAFKENAGTDVVTDILIFQKKTESESANGLGESIVADWVEVTEQVNTNPKTGESATHNVSKVFIQKPSLVLGKPSAAGTMYRPNEYTVESTGDIKPMLDAWVKSLPENVFTPIDRSSDSKIVDMEIPDGIKPGSYFIDKNGEIMRRGEDVMGSKTAQPFVPKTVAASARMKGMIELRDLLRKQMRLERSADATEREIESNRAALNKAYDAFLKKYGHLNSVTNRGVFMDDTESQLLQALEFDYDRGISKATAEREGIEPKEPSAKKADIFERRVMFPPSDYMKVETAKDALLASLNYRGKIDLAYMAEVYSKSEDEIIKELGDVVYDDPMAGTVMADEYLSGDVKTKLEEARAAALADDKYQRNVEALEKVIPADKKPSEISVSIGAAFVPTDVYQHFIKHITGAESSLSYLKSTGQWLVEYTGAPDTTLNTGTFGTSHMSAMELFSLSMMGRGAVVKQTLRYPGGSTTTIVLEKETEAAREKQSAIKNEWQKWLWSDPARADRVAAIYNDKMNRIVARKYDGSHLTFPGMNPAIKLLEHQKNGVWRGLQSFQVLYDHVVGAGKTFEMATLAMEMRRLGIARKPLFVVPNHLTLQWRSEFTRLYPGSNILAATPEDFSKENRGRMFSKIVTGDWDAVILGHSSLKKIGLPEATEKAVLEEQVNEVADAIEEMKRRRGDRNIIRDMEGIKARLEAKMKDKLAAIGKRDKVLTFDELGVDAMFIDEMHEFKNLQYNSTMDRNPGMGNPAGSAKAFDLFVKTRWLFDTFGDKTPYITATGTPVSNSLVEMFNMQRYMQYPTLKREGLHVFDAWAKQFGSVENVYEVAPSGSGFRQSTRFAKFTNLPALMSLYGSFADTITLDDLKAQEEARGKRFPVPKLVGGRPQIVVAQRSPSVENLMGVPSAEVDETGEVKFAIDLGKPIEVSRNDAGKWAAKVGDAHIGQFETEEEARLRVVERALSPSVAVSPESILGRFSNLKQLTKETKGKVNALSLTGEANKAGLDYRLIDPTAPDFAGSKINLAVQNMVRIYKESARDKGTQLVFCDLSIPLSARSSFGSKERRLYVRGDDGSLTMKRGTMHSMDGFESLPFFIVSKGDKAGKRFEVYDAATGFLVGGNFTSKAEAKERAGELIESESGRQRWLDKRIGFAEISQDQIDEYNNDNSVETEGVDSFGPEDIAGISGSAKFSVYDDIKAKLIANGVSEREIAFIHDYSTPVSKAKLFKAVNDGSVRFLLGSTPKMGAGTNVQERLVGLHHIDAPWRPSDLEQREGRIIRRGNKLYERDQENFSVFIGRYATEQTYDTRRWQILEHKARGIEQLRNFDGTMNEIEDIDGEAANAADMKAAASGDPLILEETKLRNEVKRLERLQDGHADEKLAMERKANEQQQYAEKSGPEELENIRGLIAEAEKHPADKRGFSTVTVDGKAFSDIETAAKEIGGAFSAVRAGMSNATVVFRGQRFIISKPFGDTVKVETEIGSIGMWSANESFSPSGFVQRMINHVERLVGHETRIVAQIEKAKEDAVKLRDQAKLPFAQAADLEIARADHARVRRALMAKGPAVPEEQKPMVDAAIARQKERLRDLGFGKALDEMLSSGVGNIASANRISASDKAIYGMAAEGKRANEILQFIAEASRSPFYRTLARVLLKTGINPSTTVGDGKDWKMNAGEGNKYAAGFDPKKNMVALFRVASAERNMLHELVHAATLQALGKKGLASVQMKHLFDHVKKTGKLKGMYGMTDIDEFVAEVFTNPKFQERLKSIPAPKQTKLHTAWDWLVRIIKNILGLPANSESALSAALDIGVGVMREDKAMRRQGVVGANARGQIDNASVNGKISSMPNDTTASGQQNAPAPEAYIGEAKKNVWTRLVKADDAGGRLAVLHEAKSIVGGYPELYEVVSREARDLGYDFDSEGGLDSALIKASQGTNGHKGINSSSIKQDQGSGLSTPDSYRANSTTAGRYGGGVHLPVSGQINSDTGAVSSSHTETSLNKVASIPGPDIPKKLSQKQFESILQDIDGYGPIERSDPYRIAEFKSIVRKLKAAGVYHIDMYHVTDAILSDFDKGGIRGTSVSNIGAVGANERESSVYGFLDPDDIRNSYDGILGSDSETPNVIHIKVPVEQIVDFRWDSNFNVTFGSYSGIRFVGNIPSSWIRGAYRYDIGSGKVLSVENPNEPTASAGSDAIRYNVADDAWGVAEPSKMDDVIYSLQDKHIDLKRVIEGIRATGKKIADAVNPYLQEELFHGRAAKGVKNFLDMELRPLLAQMQSMKIDMGDFEEYLWNRHAEERNQQIAKINPDMPDGGSGIKTADARAYLAGLSAERRGQFEKLATRVDAMNLESQRVLVESGLEKQETIDAWNGAYQHYVPLQREDVDSGYMGTGKGFSIRGSSTKRAMGSGRQVVDIIANLTMQRERNIVRAEKNRVSQALMGLALENPNPDFWEVDKAPKERAVVEKAIYAVMDKDGKKIEEHTVFADAEKAVRQNPESHIEQTWGDRVEERVVPGFSTRDNVVLTRINGEDHYIILNERDERAMRMAASLKNMDVDNMGRALSVVGKATRYLASVNTQYNPVFGVINLIRDVQGAMLNLSSTPLAGEQKKVTGYTVDALRGIYADIRAHRAGKQPRSNWAKLFEEFQREGGQTGYRDQYANAEQRAEAIRDELAQFKEGPPKKMVRALFGWLSDYNETMENAVRLAAYKAGLEKGMSKQQAASLAKNLTVNFNRKGQATTQIGALYAFFNASVQGSARMFQALFEMQDGNIKTLRLSKTGKKIVYGGILLGSMQAMLLAAAGFDDDEPPEFIRERNLILPIGDGKYLTLAMPLGFHVIPGIGRIATEFAMSGFKDPSKRMFDFLGMFMDSFNPVGNAGFSLQTITPSVVDPFAALAENRDFTGKEIARENMNGMDPTPGHMRAKDTATYWAKLISDGLNFISGGTEFKPGMLSPTPDQIDYLIGQATGGVGREGSKLAQSVGAGMTGEDLPLHKIPLVGRFVGDTEGQSGESAKFYAAIKRINGHEREYKGLMEKYGREEAMQYIEENPEAKLWMGANRVERIVQKLRKEKRELLKGDSGQDQIRDIDARITSVMQGFNKRVDEMTE